MRPRPIRNGRRAARGQVMLLFALMSVLLLAIAGLAIDAGMSYFSSDQVERAAAAAALAGVAYLPGDFAAAENAALVEAVAQQLQPTTARASSLRHRRAAAGHHQPARGDHLGPGPHHLPGPARLRAAPCRPHARPPSSCRRSPSASRVHSRAARCPASCDGIAGTYCASHARHRLWAAAAQLLLRARARAVATPGPRATPTRPPPSTRPIACGPHPLWLRWPARPTSTRSAR